MICMGLRASQITINSTKYSTACSVQLQINHQRMPFHAMATSMKYYCSDVLWCCDQLARRYMNWYSSLCRERWCHERNFIQGWISIAWVVTRVVNPIAIVDQGHKVQQSQHRRRNEGAIIDCCQWGSWKLRSCENTKRRRIDVLYSLLEGKA